MGEAVTTDTDNSSYNADISEIGDLTTDEEDSQFPNFSQQTSTLPMITESDLSGLSNLENTQENTQEKQNNAGEFEGFIQLREALIENHPIQVKQEEERRELPVNTADQNSFELQTQESQATTKKIILPEVIDLTQEDVREEEKKTVLWKG